MRRIILPTQEIFFEHRKFEEIFGFYDEGLKGVIRDFVMIYPGGEYNPRIYVENDELIEKIMRDYQSSPAAVIGRVAENTDWSNAVEMAALMVRDSVYRSMSELFGRLVYDVSKQEWAWAGYDLCITLHLYR